MQLQQQQQAQVVEKKEQNESKNFRSHHTCEICLEFIDFKQYTMPCKCLICGKCCLQYLLVQIDNIDFLINKKIKCPNHGCQNNFKVEEYREHQLASRKFQIPEINLLDEKLLIKHLQNDPQARNCPNPSCKYYGLLPLDIKQCKSNKFQCDLCNTEWSDASLPNKSKSVFQMLKNMIFKKNEFFSEIHKKIMAKRCPHCDIPITKYGGCYHMICRKCNFEFCWYCCQQYTSHSIYKCIFYIGLKNSIFFFAGLIFIYFTGLYSYIYYLIIQILKFALSFILHNILIVLFYLFAQFSKEVFRINYEINLQIIRYGYDRSGLSSQKKRNFHLTILTGSLFLLQLGLLTYYLYTMAQIIKFIFLEIVTLASLCFIYNSMIFTWETWMRYIY